MLVEPEVGLAIVPLFFLIAASLRALGGRRKKPFKKVLLTVDYLFKMNGFLKEKSLNYDNYASAS